LGAAPEWPAAEGHTTPDRLRHDSGSNVMKLERIVETIDGEPIEWRVAYRQIWNTSRASPMLRASRGDELERSVRHRRGADRDDGS